VTADAFGNLLVVNACLQFSYGMVHQGISCRVLLRGTTYDLGHWSLNLLFCRRGFGLVVSIVVP
jgi:hypothetical protein